MFLNFLAAGHEGIQHWSGWSVDYESILKRSLTSGYSIGQQGDSTRGRFVYLWNEGHLGTVIEMAHMTEARRRIFDGIREMSVGWNGGEPIRTTWPS